MTEEEDAPVERTLDPGKLNREQRKLLLDQVVSPTDRDGRPLRQKICDRLDRQGSRNSTSLLSKHTAKPLETLCTVVAVLFYYRFLVEHVQGWCHAPHSGGAL